MTLLPARPTDFPLPGQSVTPPEWTINWAFIALFIPLIVEQLPCFPSALVFLLPPLCWVTPAILGLSTPETEYHVRISGYSHIQLFHDLMASDHAKYSFWCQLMAHPTHLPLKSSQINTTVSFPSIQRTVLALLSAISLSMFSYFCYLIATCQAIYLFVLLQIHIMAHPSQFCS